MQSGCDETVIVGIGSDGTYTREQLLYLSGSRYCRINPCTTLIVNSCEIVQDEVEVIHTLMT